MEHFHVTFWPEGTVVSVHRGATLLEAAGQAGIILNAVCGGIGTCAKCRVLLLPQRRTVLACQSRVNQDLEVLVPSESRFFEHRILEEGVAGGAGIEPTVYRRHEGELEAEEILGIAVDVGTTTVVAKLVRMVDGKVLGTESALNPQTRFGDDVISRISYAGQAGGAQGLQKEIIGCINTLVERACEKASVEVGQVREACMVGNTTMHHLLLGLPVEQLGVAPYRPYSVDAADIDARSLGLKIHEQGRLHALANIAGFVGADTTGAALAVDIESAENGTLLVDIGTNGELVLAAGGELLSASCAAGPAFEGARIECGSRAATGAIEAVVFDGGDIGLDIIGGGQARSICGSGLIDAVAVIRETGVIDETGRFTDGQGLAEPIRKRISQRDGEPVFRLSVPDEGDEGVFLTQKDIRQVQLAKAAIRAGITLLLQKGGLKDSGLREILLAGAFGSYIRRESAIRIGLLPPVEVHQIRFVGNAAGSGAQMALLSESVREQAARLASRIRYVEIANEAAFTEAYTEAMLF